MSKAYYVSRVGRVAMGNDIKFLVKKKKNSEGGDGKRSDKYKNEGRVKKVEVIHIL